MREQVSCLPHGQITTRPLIQRTSVGKSGKEEGEVKENHLASTGDLTASCTNGPDRIHDVGQGREPYKVLKIPSKSLECAKLERGRRKGFSDGIPGERLPWGCTEITWWKDVKLTGGKDLQVLGRCVTGRQSPLSENHGKLGHNRLGGGKRSVGRLPLKKRGKFMQKKENRGCRVGEQSGTPKRRPERRETQRKVLLESKGG